MTMLVGPLQYDSTWSSVWYPMSPFTRFFLFILLLVSTYTSYFASAVLVHLHSLRTVQNDDSLRKSLAQLEHRSENLRQIIVAMSYFFGLTFFLQIQNAFWTPENNRPVGLMVLENFRLDFRFAAVIFLVLLLLHSVQWFVFARIRRVKFRPNT